MRKIMVAILAVVLILLAGCGGKSPKTKETGTAETEGKVTPVITVEKQKQPVMLSAMAIAEPEQVADLSFGVSGTITALHVAKGMKVSKGQMLATLDTGTAETNGILHLKLEDARRDLEKKKADLLRSETLFAEGAIPRIEIESRQREVERAANEVAQVMRNLSDTKLVAPFSGTVVEVSQQAGEMSVPGTPVIRLVDLSEVKLTLDVTGDMIEQYKLGQTASVIRESIKTDQGKVTAVSPLTDPQTGKYRVEVTVNNAGEEWRGGMLARVEVPRNLATGIILPLSCVGMNQDKRYVLVIENGVAKRRQVQVGQIIEDSIEILTGVQEGEKVISAGIAYIVEGEKIVAKGE